MIYSLENSKDAHALILSLWSKIKVALDSGKRLSLEIKAESKSRDQEEMYHSLIGKIAKQAEHQGARWDVESWKRCLVDQWAHDSCMRLGRVVPSLDGERIVQLGIQTRKFTKEQGTEFIEFLFAWSAQNGIDLV